MYEEKLKAYSQNDPNATIARIDVDNIDEHIISQKGTVNEKDIQNRILRTNMLRFSITGINNLENSFGCKLKTLCSFTSKKMVQLIFGADEGRFAIIKSTTDYLGEIDYILNFLYCDDDASYVEEIDKQILYKIENNTINKVKKDKNTLKESEVKNLYWRNMRMIDRQLSGIMSSGAAKVVSYCIVFEKILVFFQNTTKGRYIYILEYPENSILPLIDLG